MSAPENANPLVPASARSPRTWDFMETLLVALLAYGAFALTGFPMTIVLLMVHPSAAVSSADFQSLWNQGNWQGAGLIVGSPPAIAVIWFAVRKARRDFSEYLALNWPSRADLLYAFALLAIVVVAEAMFRAAIGAAKPETDNLRVVESAGGLLVLLIGCCVAAPILEEFIVRGFMFRGWSESFLGPIGAIVLTSAVWAMNHTQYDLFGRLEIFVIGLALGHCRWRSNSTWLTVVVHSALNTFLLFVAGPYT